MFRLKDKEVSDYKEKCDREIRKIKDQSKDQIELNEKKLEIEKQFILKKSNQLKFLVASQRREIDELNQRANERNHDLHTLISQENRYENLRHLEQTYESMADMIREHDV